MPIEPGSIIHLLGAGGHGRVVADALLAAGVPAKSIIPRDSRPGLTLLGMPVATPEICIEMSGAYFHVAVGSAEIRLALHMSAIAQGARPVSIVHPRASVSLHAMVESAAFVAALAAIGPGAKICTGAIVNHGAVVDHDVVIGEFSHIAPNATLGGGVRIGDRVLVGAGTVVLPGVTIGNEIVIGAGAVMRTSITGPGTWVGNPARKLEK